MIYLKLKNWVFTLLIVLLLASCIKKNTPKIIPKKDLIDMLVNLNIYDALAMDNYITAQLGGLDSSDIYSSFFSKYPYNKEDLKYTMEYYSSKPKKLAAINDAVFAELSKKSDELNKLKEYFSYSGLQNIWNYRIPEQKSQGTSNLSNHFDIKIDSAGTYVITAMIKMKTEDQSINPRITAYFYNPNNNTESKRYYFKSAQIFKSDYFREYQIYTKNSDSLLSHIHIILPDRDNKDTLFLKSMEISSFTVGVMRNDPDKPIKKK